MIDNAAIFAQHFSRLVVIASRESQDKEQELHFAVRAAEAMLRVGPAVLGVRDWRLLVNEAPLADALSGVPDLTLAARLVGHSVYTLSFEAFAPGAELIAAARVIASEPHVGDRGRTTGATFNQLGLRKVRVEVVGTLSPDSPGDAVVADLEAMRRRYLTPPADIRATRLTPEEGIDHQRLAPPDGRASFTTPRHTEGGITRGLDTKTGSAANLGIGTPPGAAPAAAGRRGTPTGSEAPGIFGRLDRAEESGQLARLIDDLVREAESQSLRGETQMTYELMHAVVTREATAQGTESRTPYLVGVKRLLNGALLRSLARHMVLHREHEAQIMEIYQRLGDEAGTLMVEALAEAEQRAERRALVDALAKVKLGGAALRHSLSDPRWYVVRNAADLLGIYQAEGAADELIKVASHSDERVRRAAVSALGQLTAQAGTTDPLLKALADKSAPVRQAAAAGLGLRRSAKALDALLAKLEKEDMESVQVAILDALGRNGSPTAVNTLIEAAEPGGLFKRKSIAYRCAATAALRNVDAASAKTAISKLKQDKEPAVRTAAGG